MISMFAIACTHFPQWLNSIAAMNGATIASLISAEAINVLLYFDLQPYKPLFLPIVAYVRINSIDMVELK